MRKTKENTDISKELILNAAEIEFSKYGYIGAKIDNIAKRTKMTKGAIFWHYKSKLILYKVILQRSIMRLTKIVREAFATDEPIMEQCNNVILRTQKDRSFEILTQLGLLDQEKRISKIAMAGIQKETAKVFMELFEIMKKAKKDGKLKAESNVTDILMAIVIFMSGFTHLNMLGDLLNIRKDINREAAAKILFKGLAYYQQAKT